jgi:hypothetical protein
MADVIGSLPGNTPYVLCVLRPSRERDVDQAMVPRLVASLGGGWNGPLDTEGYSVIAGHTGARPALIRSSERPFRTSVRLGALAIQVRMDSWLPSDTIRRAGFGHVIANHRHALAIDRGLSLVAWPPGALPVTAYEGGLYADQPRYVLSKSRE